MNHPLYAHVLTLTGKSQLQWSAKDDGSSWGKPSRSPSHVYTVTTDTQGAPTLEKRPIKAGEKIGQADLKLLRMHQNPEAYHYKGVAFGMGVGFCLTLTSILLALLIAQMTLDKDKQQDIENEAKRAIAICSASEAIARDDYEKAEQILNDAEHLFPNADQSPFAASLQRVQAEDREATQVTETDKPSAPNAPPRLPEQSTIGTPMATQTPQSVGQADQKEWVPDGQPNKIEPVEQSTSVVLGGEQWMPPDAPQKTPNPVADLPDLRVKSEDDKPEITWQPPARMDNVQQPQPEASSPNQQSSNSAEWQPQ